MKQPKVSIVVPTYNRVKLLPRALDSILAQSFSDWETIVVDDGSTDDTPQLLSEYENRFDDRLVCIKQPNAGPSAARNKGIEAASGRFIAFLDSDDEFLPTKLSRQLELFDLEPNLGLVYSDYAYVNLEGERHESMFNTKARFARKVKSSEIAPRLHVCSGDVFDDLLNQYFIATIVGMVRRDVLRQDIRFDETQAYAEEWLFYLNVVRRARVGFVDEALSLHHYVPESLARTDKSRNTLRYRNLLHKIERSFDDLSHRQRKRLRHQIARANAQLAYDELRRGQNDIAARHFLDAAIDTHDLFYLRRALSAWIGRYSPSKRGRKTDPKREAQDPTTLVR